MTRLLLPLHLTGAAVVARYTCPTTGAAVLVLDREHPEGGAWAVDEADAETDEAPTPTDGDDR